MSGERHNSESTPLGLDSVLKNAGDSSMSGAIATQEARVSIIIPAFNEKCRLDKTLHEVWDYLDARKQPFEIIVVDDGSTDSTADIAQEHAQLHPELSLISYSPNRGKGHAVRTGMLRGKGDLIVFCDADLATPIAELDNLMRYIDMGYDVVIGSRAVRGSNITIRQRWYREFGGRTLNLIVRLFALPGIHDTQCGFKLFTRAASQNVFSLCAEDSFGFDIEALYLARKLKLDIAEVPVSWQHIEGSKVKFSRDAPRVLLAIFNCVRRHIGRGGKKHK